MQFSAILLFFSLLIAESLGLCSNDTKCFNDLPCCGTDTKGNALCCPYVDGVCCGDNQHCCDKASQCLPGKGICEVLNMFRIPMAKKFQSIVPLLKRNPTDSPKPEELCPSKMLMCPGRATCCPGPYIGFDCCPLPDGVCCANFQHCCPFNTTCDSVQARCIDSKGRSIHWYKKTKAVPLHKKRAKNVDPSMRKVQSFGNSTCPTNRTMSCLANETCCSIGGKGKQGCCNAVKAVCCLGGNVCCPFGTDCDIYTETCIRRTTRNGTHVAPIQMVMTATTTLFQFQSTKVENATLNTSLTIVCPGGKYSCPNYMSCCPTNNTGKYGCCPFPNAVCCSDSFHCCPTGSKCDLKQDKCVRGGLFMPLFVKKKSLQVEIPKIMPVASKTFMSNKDCPDKTQCPDGNTCCQLPSKQYGCCPLPEAVCCSDKIHCCPHGTVCDLKAGGCKPANAVSLIPLKSVQKKTPLLGVGIKKSLAFNCPGGLYECSQKTTCCRLDNTRWGCCPFEKGVCCNNNKNCCPGGYKCDMINNQCIKGNLTINF